MTPTDDSSLDIFAKKHHIFVNRCNDIGSQLLRSY